MPESPIQIRAIIDNERCDKVQNILGGWEVTVRVDLVPATGESVANLEGGTTPHAGLLTGGGTEFAMVPLNKLSGNTWAGSASVFQEPMSAVFRCRFISDIVEESCNCIQ